MNGAAQRLHLKRLPAYTPEPNPGEGVWVQLRGRHDHFICRAPSQRQLSIDGTEAPCQTITTPTRSYTMPSLAPSLVVGIAGMVAALGIGL
jgi:hypothetical protein